ncbi:glycosyltransferase family 2 protein [Photobacterium aphoticum]|uniref:Glycosyltransferase 2-like domain-containing protein n=1 Tax=Photobacterium aphoticum TaxID=754436 RepID=A0A0J1GH40_9GAMM|nr:glycosyltransferase family 2 protein [Photobacterium aphoticum]KLU98875.1 hypothetical protein ABT58_20235 [Photobacterium aphoticum]PSU56684.1 hypothetical protein C9I90_12185 [Photobacterium aphoticum]GHA38929.1 glycosyl transferase [Photobacterium aphoticum]
MKSIKLSVIIPTFNRAQFLSRSVNSILSQDIDDIEIIIVDDYKKDQTEEIKESFNHLSCVKVVKSWAHRPSGARNIGVKNALGQYISFLDDDDIYLPGRLNNMLTYIENESEKLSFVSSGRLFEVNDFQKVMLDDSQKYGVIKLSDVLDCNGIDIGFMMRREFFNQLDGFDENLSSLEDWDLILRSLMISDGYKIERLDYAVNFEVDRPRVSLTQEQSRNSLADKYLFKFGKKWYFENKFKGLCESGEFNIIYGVKYLLHSSSFYDLKSFVYYTIKTLKGV